MAAVAANLARLDADVMDHRPREVEAATAGLEHPLDQLANVVGREHQRREFQSQAATILGVHRDTVAMWADRGRKPVPYRPGGHGRYRATDVERLRVELGRPTLPPPARTPHPPPRRSGRHRDLLSIGQVAALVDVDMRTVRRWDDAGFLPAASLTPGGHRRWQHEDVERFAAKHGLA